MQNSGRDNTTALVIELVAPTTVSPIGKGAMSTLLFVYGTLKRGCSNHRHLAGPECSSTPRARRPGYCLYDLGGYPAIVAKPDDTAGVVGEVWSVDDEALRRLDQFEGVHEGLYRREPVAIVARRSRIATLTRMSRCCRVTAGPEVGSNGSKRALADERSAYSVFQRAPEDPACTATTTWREKVFASCRGLPRGIRATNSFKLAAAARFRFPRRFPLEGFGRNDFSPRSRASARNADSADSSGQDRAPRQQPLDCVTSTTAASDRIRLSRCRRDRRVACDMASA